MEKKTKTKSASSAALTAQLPGYDGFKHISHSLSLLLVMQIQIKLVKHW